MCLSAAPGLKCSFTWRFPLALQSYIVHRITKNHKTHCRHVSGLIRNARFDSNAIVQANTLKALPTAIYRLRANLIGRYISDGENPRRPKSHASVFCKSQG